MEGGGRGGEGVDIRIICKPLPSTEMPIQDILVYCYESCTKLKFKKPTGSLVCSFLMCVSPVQDKMANARLDISYLPSVDGEIQ
jgi:hypothetical protein